ncbi:hypothetical protein SAMN04515617_11717 [Collimonas sp. OK242]|jgi:hypothetical protein|nr:hypothetical protein SAMN04515617_11717 [Collimonas sp. OK242]
MKHAIIFAAISILSLIVTTGAVAAGGPGRAVAVPHTGATSAATTSVGKPVATVTKQTGQPNQSCGSATAPNTPGNAATAPGAAFNPDGQAGTVYAGQQPQNSRNPTSVSQYDVACSKQPSR